MEAILAAILKFFQDLFGSDRAYKVSFEVKTNLQDGTTIKANCNEIGFKNTGTSIVWINSIYPIYPNEPFSANGNWREIDTTIYNFKFLDSAGNAATPPLVNSLVIIRKTYEK